MSNGFGIKTQSKDQFIKNFIKTSKALLSGFETPEEAKQHFSKMWFKEYSLKHNEYTIGELLNPVCRNLEIEFNPDFKNYRIGKVALVGYNGIWRVMLLKRPDNSLELDIAVMAGSCYRFHSEVIKFSITNTYGLDVYNQWRIMVNSNLGSLTQLIQVIRSKINHVAWSYTCSPSSARLCNRVGISTSRGAAFLFPANYR